MNYEKLAEILFPHITKTPDDYEKLYPKRELPEGAKVPDSDQARQASFILETFTALLLTRDWHISPAADFFSESRIPMTSVM